jgi:molybdopterin adenylyltransferase
MNKPQHSQPETTPSHRDHKRGAPQQVGCVVITCSDTRTAETDTSGQLIMRLLKEHGHEVSGYEVVKDDPSEIRGKLQAAVQKDAVQAIIINGGTGLSRRDSTFETIDGMLEKRLEGFGEIFRYLSYQDIGSPAMMSRATAGLYRGRIIFSTPGSEGAVRLAMEKLILPELGHIIREITK